MQLKNYEGDEVGKGVFHLDLISPSKMVISRKLFEKQRKRGIYKNHYGDDTWIISDRGERKGIHFERIKFAPQNMTRQEFIEFLKLYVCKCVDQKKSILSVAGDIHSIIALSNATEGFQRRNVEAICLKKEKMVRAFLTEIGLEEFELNVQDIESAPNSKTGDIRRKLSTDFWTYFVMDYELKQFWEKAKLEEKLVYAPLYLFWILAHILPMRPCEFVLIERDCIKHINGKYYISIPKSGIKGKPWAITNDRKTQDKTYSFAIDEKTAKEILWYANCVKEDIPEDPFIQNRLFNNMAFNRINVKRQPRHIEFSRNHLDKLKKSFLKELEDQGYKKVEDIDMACVSLRQKWISDWNLYDLRHLALINMIQRGIDPTVIMIFAGHDDIAQACHYYTNVSEMAGIRIRFEKRYHSDYSMPKTGIDIIGQMLSNEAATPLIGGMCCYSGPEHLKVQHCAKYFGCAEDGCPFYRPEDINTYKNEEREILISRETRINNLMKFFISSLWHEEKECAEKALFELQRESLIYERSVRKCHAPQNIQNLN